jgi:hypothetical protein
MKPVDQTVFTVPGGNCFSACVATLLAIPLDDVPYFMGSFEEEDGVWWQRFLAWLKPRGLWAINFKCPPDGDWYPVGEYILSAGSPRGDFDHSVVALGRDIIHDPHPSRDGLVRREKQEATILVPIALDGYTPPAETKELRRKLRIAEACLVNDELCHKHGVYQCIECEDRCVSCGYDPLEEDKRKGPNGETLCADCKAVDDEEDAEISRRLTRDDPGWERAWNAIAAMHGDRERRCECCGETWQYMETDGGKHVFRHRHLNGKRAFAEIPVEPADFAAAAAEATS